MLCAGVPSHRSVESLVGWRLPSGVAVSVATVLKDTWRNTSTRFSLAVREDASHGHASSLTSFSIGVKVAKASVGTLKSVWKIAVLLFLWHCPRGGDDEGSGAIRKV